MDGGSDDDENSSELPEPEQVLASSLSDRGMSPSPPKKRQRFSNASALSKPFRSPLKTPLKTPLGPSQNPKAADTQSSPGDPTKVLTPTPVANSSKFRTPTQVLHSGSNSSATPSPRLSQLQKQHTALLNELAAVRANLETTNQALEIEASTTDSDLEALIRKWKTVSRNAAEEVFPVTKERIDGVGGVKAWRKQDREMKRGWGWEEEGQKKQVCDSGDSRSREGIEEGQAKKEADQDAEDGDEDDEVT